MKSPRYKLIFSIQKVILLTSITVGLILAVLSGIFFLTQITNLVSNQYTQFTKTQTFLFSSNISQDLLTGSYAEINRKCEELFKDPNIESIIIKTTDEKQICDLSKTNQFDNLLQTNESVYFDENKTNKAATVQVAFSLASLKTLIAATTKWLFSGVLILTFILIFFNYLILTFIFNGLRKQLNHISKVELITSDTIRQMSIKTSAIEISEAQAVIDQFKKFAEKILEQQTSLSKQKISIATEELSKQVAHDIRSPLSALNMLLNHTSHLPEPQRILTRNAIQRINDIANNLLNKEKQNTKSNNGQATAIKPELISPIISMILSEKRTQFRERSEVSIQENLTYAYGLFSKIDSSQLKRVISNLINNSVESIINNGRIFVRIFLEENNVGIEIQDNGKGIPTNIIDKIGEKGVSFGKEGTTAGSGLGLFHAIQTIKSFGGKLLIKSKENEGTTITIFMPICETPSWFCEKISLAPETLFVCLDDDISIHQIWQQRLLQFNDFIEFKSFTSAIAFIEWYNNSGRKSIFAIDFELLNQDQSGLDIIEELGIQSNSILVTSRYNEEIILNRCKKNKLKIIPKSMAEQVPVNITNSN